MAERHYNPETVLQHVKNYPIHREELEHQRILDWAHETGVTAIVSTTGELPESLVMKWIDAHAGMPNPVIRHQKYMDNGLVHRTVEVICHKCASTHTHGGELASRPTTENNHRFAHCGSPYHPEDGYYIEDTLAIEEWETIGLAANNATRA